ncbi:nematode fatty acid retinoid binding protein (Gp-FAR-1) domain-containing protein [Ditylenchus destructor]|nr:nematode fatty acid retinoid binding protein (Gp-FAR-1) domain-containing protein [Ditylenchus destructor]
MRNLVLLVLLAVVVFVSAAPNALPSWESLDKIPDQFKDIVPDEVKTFYSELTEEDKVILKELAGKHATFENEDQALEALKEKSPKLYEKAKALHTMVKEKIDSLKAEAKTFVTGVVEKLRSLKPKGDEKPNLNKLRDEASAIIEQYKALSEEAKEDLKATFPKITGVIQNEKFQKLAQGLLKKDEAPAA